LGQACPACADLEVRSTSLGVVALSATAPALPTSIPRDPNCPYLVPMALSASSTRGTASAALLDAAEVVSSVVIGPNQFTAVSEATGSSEGV
jgi:hypothetical protein